MQRQLVVRRALTRKPVRKGSSRTMLAALTTRRMRTWASMRTRIFPPGAPARKAAQSSTARCSMKKKSGRGAGKKNNWAQVVASNLGGIVQFKGLLCPKDPIGEKSMQTHRKKGGSCAREQETRKALLASAKAAPPPPRVATA
eukprot:5134083-Prymnesium_polylepis.1